VEEMVSRAKKVTVGADIWSKKSLSASFLGISACFYCELSEQSEHLFLNLLQVNHPHTGEMIANAIMSALQEWKIKPEQVLLIITDNGANMLKARKLLGIMSNATTTADDDSDNTEMADATEAVVRQAGCGQEGVMEDTESESDGEGEEDGEVIDDVPLDLDNIVFNQIQMQKKLPSMSCLAHSIQLVVKDGLKDDSHDSVQKFLTKIRSLVKKVRVSSVNTEILLKKCSKTLIVDCPTRWSSTLYMIKRFLDLRSAISSLFAEQKWDCLVASEWTRLEKLAVLLQPFADYTNLLQTDSEALSNIIPAILELELHLNESGGPAVISTQLLASLRSRFNNLLDPMDEKFIVIPAAATLLDPLVNKYLRCRPDLQATAERFVIELVSIST
jgi:hypothetical protein